MMEEVIEVTIAINAILKIDREKWPEGWDLIQEVGHQIGFDDAIEYEVEAVVEREE